MTGQTGRFDIDAYASELDNVCIKMDLKFWILVVMFNFSEGEETRVGGELGEGGA
jgi:hypothetical protein